MMARRGAEKTEEINKIFSLNFIILIMRLLLLIIPFLFSCTNKKYNEGVKENTSNRSEIINYLKYEFHITVDTSKIDSNYRKNRLLNYHSLEIDSLINSNLYIVNYEPLNLSFIRFYNYFGIHDTTRKNIFNVYLVEDNTTRNFYIDFIDNDAGMVIEPVCAYSFIRTPIKSSDSKNYISPDNIDAYNSINSSRMYGESEFEFKNKKSGIQSYLNAAFRYNKPTKKILDSLFFFYDHHLYSKNDLLIADPKELYNFLRIQAARIRKEPDYGSREKSLVYLKDQISLLLLQANNTENERLFIWVYTSNSHLRVRRLLISGNKVSTFSYFINEYELCFE